MQNKAANTLRLIASFFNNREIDYWLEAGTALGVYRDKKILPWDHDIDIGVWYNSFNDFSDIETYFNKSGFKLVVQKNFPYVDNIMQLKAQYDMECG